MCYGALEPKYLMRESAERMKGVAFAADKSEEPGKIPEAGLFVRLWDMIRRIERKDLKHG